MFRLFLSCLIILFSLFVYADKSNSEHIVDGLLNRSKDFQRNNVDSCHYLAKQALEISKSIQYANGISGAYLQLSAVMMIRGNDDSAMYFCHQSLLVSESNNNYKLKAFSYVLLSYIYQDRGMQDSALSAIHHALRYSQLSQDSIGLGRIYVSMGYFYSEYKDYPKSLFYYKSAYTLSLKNNSLSSVSDALLGIANVYYFTGKHKTALTYYLQVDSLSRKLNEPTSVAKNQNNIALCYMELKEKKKALYYYGLALDGYLKYGMRFEEANVYYNLGELHEYFKQPDSAIYYGNKALLLARELEDLYKVADCYKLLATAYSTQGNFAKAYAYQEKFTLLNDSLLNTEKVRSISEMQTKYETEKKEQQITVLDAQGKTRTAQRNFFIAGSGVLLLGLFILALYYVQRNKLAKKNALISEQKIETLLNETELKTYNAMIEGQEEERKRIASDLHDRLGSMLATVKLLFSALDTKIDKAQEENTAQYIKANQLLDEACSEVRRISHNLSTGMVMSFGLVTAIQELCDSVDQSGLIKCKLMTYGMDERLDQSIETGVYRIVQELFSNILKHAKAQHIVVQLNHMESSLNITVEDDGVGFNVEEKKQSGGMGLKNLSKRAAQLNGLYTVDSHPGKGTISIIEIPILKDNT